MKEEQIKVACHQLLKRCGQHYALRFSWRRECKDFSLIAYCGHVPNSGSNASRQLVVSGKQMVGGAVIDGKENEKEERLCLFGFHISVDIHYAFLRYRPLSDNDNRREKSIIKLPHLCVSVATALTSSEQREKRGGHRQKGCAESFTSNVSEAVNQHIGRVFNSCRSGNLKIWNCRLRLLEAFGKRAELESFTSTKAS